MLEGLTKALLDTSRDVFAVSALLLSFQLFVLRKPIPHFRRMLESTRKLFSGGLTYSANWDEAEAVRHWDLMDGIAINAFHPLTESTEASPDDLVAGARAVHEKLLALKQRTGKVIWFIEVGFKSIEGTAMSPWDSEL